MASTQKQADGNHPAVHVAEEYKMLHEVAKVLHSSYDLKRILEDVLRAVIKFRNLEIEGKGGVFLADPKKKILNLFCLIGPFSEEFRAKEKEVPFGSCLCGRAAVSGEILMSENCFSDPRHERTVSDMKPHGHYIIPLRSESVVIGVMFLYTDISPSWYEHSREVLMSVGGLVADVIVRKQLEEELDQHRNRLEELVASRTSDLMRLQEQSRRLSRQIQSTREEEKSRVAREVHDGLGQSMTALKMDLAQLEKRVPANLSSLLAQIEAITQGVDEAIKSVQRIATELRPPILDAFGLCEAIAWQAGEYQKRLGIQFDLNCLSEKLDLDPELQTALFRIFQETITNIVRHAEASWVWVGLNKVKDHLILTVQDNGKGIKASEIIDSNSLGLIGIRERLFPWDGQVQFKGLPGAGTLVTVTLPISGP